jgi:ribosomal protein S18 acetylase RimI-like enzyme/SAM-dependent methyltransferase
LGLNPAGGGIVDNRPVTIGRLIQESLGAMHGREQLPESVRERFAARYTDISHKTESSDTLFYAVANSLTHIKPVGFVMVRHGLHKFPKPEWEDHSVAELENLHVAPSFRGRKLGQKLLAVAEEKARELGIATLVTEAAEFSVPWLVHNGFAPVGRREDPEFLKNGIHMTLMYMEKPLGLPQGVSPLLNMPAETMGRLSVSQMAQLAIQYDLPSSHWYEQGNESNPNRRLLFIPHLTPFIQGSLDQDVLDIGGGLGWLSDMVLSYGGNPVCLEPSKRNAKEGRKAYPAVPFVNATFQEYEPDKKFDRIYAIMVDNFLDLEGALRKVRSLLNPRGKFITITSDYIRTVQGRSDYQVEVEYLNDFHDEAAVHIRDPKTYGDLYVITHYLPRYLEHAAAGLQPGSHAPLYAVEGHPHFGKIKSPLFHMLEFTV